MIKHIPNLLTLCNLLLGVIGIVMALDGNPIWGSYCIWLAAVFDFLDGFAARMLHVTSPIGKELDSLADMVTFGVLPSMIIFKMTGYGLDNPIAYISFSLALFSALRLAKFNTDPRQSDQFIGLPTPASAFFISSLPFIVMDNPWNMGALLTPPVLLIIALALSIMLVAELPLFSLKFKDFKWKNNIIRYIFAAISLVLILTLKIAAIPISVVLYVFMSVINLKTSK